MPESDLPTGSIAHSSTPRDPAGAGGIVVAHPARASTSTNDLTETPRC